ncbi:glycosyltransferase [candidate division FCPU426 bacterium]|nr:glycosyltransferase [candidate division FCPU426 bacterium]
MFAKADLHVHSKYSEHPSEWFLQRIGANESYIEPEFIYQEAKAKGMTYVTLTDHNCIDGGLLLQSRHPEDFFLGLESTTYFPEDHCKIHILVYGLNEKQFSDIQQLRLNIYEMRGYLQEQKLAHAVAHATYSENGKLTLEHLEKLILLFDVFEGINGTRNRMHNQVWSDTLDGLTPENIDMLYHKYRIDPCSDTPWKKGFVGGSDDHSGLYIAKAHTIAKANTMPDFLEKLKLRQTRAAGRHNDYKSFAFALYKIACDFSRSKATRDSGSFLSALHDLVFDKKQPGFKNRLLLNSIQYGRKDKDDGARQLLADLITNLRAGITLDSERKLEIVYDKLADISDEFIKVFLKSLEHNLHTGNFLELLMSLSSSLPGVFLSLPFFNTLGHLYKDRDLVEQLQARFGGSQDLSRKRVLWFTDTLTDLNGVSSTLNSIGWLTQNSGLELRIVTALAEHEKDKPVPPNTLKLPCLHHYTPTEYKDYTLKIPSVLRSIELIYNCEPDLIMISTPGPVGWIGLLASQLLKVKHVGIYHTDFHGFTQQILTDESVVRAVEGFVHWFYSFMDEIRVPSKAYIEILKKREYETNKLKIFPRGIDSQKFSPKNIRSPQHRQTYWTDEGFNLLYVGRISKEKNLSFLADIYEQLLMKNSRVNLTLVGDGPYLADLKSRLENRPGIHFTGSLPYEELPYIYSSADLLVFPSCCDTFGMVVLEAQSCGLPALVTDQGGPQEIIIDNITGWALPANNPSDWSEKILEVADMKEKIPESYLSMRRFCRQHVVIRFDWETAFQELFSLDHSKALVFRDPALAIKEKFMVESSLILE